MNRPITLSALVSTLFLSTLCLGVEAASSPKSAESRTSLRHGRGTLDQEIQDANQERKLLTDLEKKFYISKPDFSFSGLQFNLDYLVSDYVEESNLEYKVYDGHNCSKGANEITTNSGYLYSELLVPAQADLRPRGNGTDLRNMEVTLTIDPDTIVNTPLYEDFGAYAHVYFCVYFCVLSDTPEQTGVIPNWIETPVLLVIDLTADIAIIDRGSFSNMDLVLLMAEQDSAVEAYLCDSDGNVVSEGNTTQGTALQICVTPTAGTMEQGAFIREIEQFYFSRDDNVHYAILQGDADSSGLTVLVCPVGTELCSFETLLPAVFFSDPGIIHGEGIAYLQFGNGEVRRASVVMRQTGTNIGHTLEQAPTRFGFDIVALPNGYYRAYEATSSSSTLSVNLLVLLALQAATCWLSYF